MSWSLKYNNIDLSTYGLTVVMTAPALSAFLSAAPVQLQDRAYVSNALALAKPIRLEVVVKAIDTATLLSYLDSIKRICTQREAKQLILDILDDRYYTARFESLSGQMISPFAFRGELLFSADDPLAYDVNETSSDFNIDADPKNFALVVGGSAYAKPLYTLTAGEDLTGITLKFECVDTKEELQWEGDLANGEVLTIDAALWIVKKEGTASMATVSGQFPRLPPSPAPGLIHLKVTGFSNTGTLNITYREAFL